MKKNLFLLFVLFPFLSKCQKIEEKTFDKFDSAIIVKTEMEEIQSYTSRPLKVYLIKTLIIKKRFDSLKQNTCSVLFLFGDNKVVAIDKASRIKLEFEDGKIMEYLHNGKSQINTPKDWSYITATASEDDLLFHQKIKSARIYTPNDEFDFEIKEDKEDFIIKSYQIVKSQFDEIAESSLL